MQVVDRFMEHGSFSIAFDPAKVTAELAATMREACLRWARIAVFDTEGRDIVSTPASNPLAGARWSGMLQRYESPFAVSGMTLTGLISNGYGRGSYGATDIGSTASDLDLDTYITNEVQDRLNIDFTSAGLSQVASGFTRTRSETPFGVVKRAALEAGATFRFDPDETLVIAQQVGDDLDVLICDDGLFDEYSSRRNGRLGASPIDAGSLAELAYAFNSTTYDVGVGTPPYEIHSLNPRLPASSEYVLEMTLPVSDDSTADETGAAADAAAAAAGAINRRPTFRSTDSWAFTALRPGDRVHVHSALDGISGTDTIVRNGTRYPASLTTIESMTSTLDRRSVYVCWYDGTDFTAVDLTEYIAWPETFVTDVVCATIPYGEIEYAFRGSRVGGIPIPAPPTTTYQPIDAGGWRGTIDPGSGEGSNAGDLIDRPFDRGGYAGGVTSSRSSTGLVGGATGGGIFYG